MSSIGRRNFILSGGLVLAAASVVGISDTTDTVASKNRDSENDKSLLGDSGMDLQESKEFQLKVKLDVDRERHSPEVVDARSYEIVQKALSKSVVSMSDVGQPRFLFPKKPKFREAIRYDTAPRSENGILRKQWLSLAIEVTDKRTKLKCKHHSLMPELILETPKKSICYPSLVKSDKHTKPLLKIEQDLHFNNTKTCASGSLYLPGRRTDVSTLGFFSEYFPGLDSLLPANTPLHAVQHWRETVYDDIEVGWGDIVFGSVMLVNRWDVRTNTLVESELAYKVRKPMGSPWNYQELRLASRLYGALHETGLFRLDPPIFYYLDPVSSIDIVRV